MDGNTFTAPKSHLLRRALEKQAAAGLNPWRPAINLLRLCAVSDSVEIFKKTLCAADLKPAGRDVAKDMLELDSMSVQDTIELKITGERPAARQSRWQLCATSDTSRVIWEFACQDGAASFGAVTRSGRAHEKQCYADF